jgi:hypothetical protein
MHEKRQNHTARIGALTRRCGRFLAGAMLAIAPANAVSAQAAKKPSVGGSLDLGFVQSSGNTRTTTLSFGDNFGWTATPKLQVRQTLRSIYGEVDDKVNANLIDIDVSGDYKLVERLGVTASVGFDRNPFAGIARRVEQSVGVSWHIESARHDSLRFTGGMLWTQQRNTADVESNFTSVRVGLSYRCPLGPRAYLLHAMEAIPNLDVTEDWRFNSETSVVAALRKKFSLKVSYTVHYDHLPEPTFKKMDRIATAGIQFAY